MKAARGSIPRLIDQPDPSIRFYLFHGPNDSGSRALANRLLAATGAEKFSLAAGAAKADPALLAAEAGAISLFGGTRLIWVEPAGDEIIEAVKILFEAPAIESPVAAIAGTLRKSSALLKLAETHSFALCHASYAPEGRAADRMVMEAASAVGLRLEPAVATRIAISTDGNQAIIGQELAKLALYLDASSDQPRELTHDVLDLLSADSGEGNLMGLSDLALAGRTNELFDELDRVVLTPGETVPVVRALQRRLLQLAALRARVEQGERLDDVMMSMGKSLFWKDKPLMQRLVSGWNAERLAQMLERSALLEKKIFFSDEPPVAVLEEELVTIARAAQKRR